MDKEYKTKVKTQYPKTLEDAIKCAQIYDDMLDKKGITHAFASHKNKTSNFKGSKRKYTTASKAVVKKPKGARGPLSHEDFERARKEKLCFLCLGDHEKKDCPQLKGKEPERGKGKEKALHMVQVLPLEDSPKYSAVQVSHSELLHECCVTAAMWQPTMGPHELFRMHGTIEGQRVRILVDDGATHNFLNYKLVKKLHLAQTPSTHTYTVSMMNGTDKEVWDTEVKNVALHVQGHTMHLDFHVMNMSRADVVLSHAWLHGLGPSLK